jgi:O-antigen/teichoic acid export membrane protein
MDSGLVGKVLGTTALGFYQIAYKFATIPVTEITQASYKLTFPAYSQLQDNVERLRGGYLKTLRVVTLISAPLAAGMFIMVPDFVRIFLGDKWIPAASCMQVLSLWGFVLSISANTGSLFQAVGRPRLIAKIVFARFIIMAVLLYPFSLWWGITGTAMAALLSALIIDPIALYEVIKIIECKTIEFCKLIFVPAVNSLVMVFFVLAIKKYLMGQIQIPGFFLLVILGALFYFTACYITQAEIRDVIGGYKVNRKEQIT